MRSNRQSCASSSNSSRSNQVLCEHNIPAVVRTLTLEMNSKPPKTSSKLTKSITRIQSSPTQSTPSLQHSSSLSSLPCVSSHLAMIELKQKILTSIAKLSDRDTQQIAIDELQTLIKTLQNDAVPMLLNCLCHASSTDPKPFVKKESIRLLGTVCVSHVDCCEPHLGRIIGFLAKALRESDSGVREACKDVIGELSRVYLKGGEGGLVSLFVKPVFEAMGENNKGVQIGAAMCLGKVVDCGWNESGFLINYSKRSLGCQIGSNTKSMVVNRVK